MSVDFRSRVAVVGVGCTPFGELYEFCDALADALKLFGRPVTRVHNYCASGMDAFRNGCLAVAAGMYDVALVVGFEKMRDGNSGRPNRSHPVIDFGERAPHVFALSAQRYFTQYGASKKTLAAVVICRADLATQFTGRPVCPRALALAVASGQPYSKPSFGYVGFDATVQAAASAYAQAA